MATLYIAEFERPRNQWVNIANAPPIAEQTVTISGASAPSVAFNAKTAMVRIHTDAICSIKFGATAPTATVTNMRLAADTTEYFSVNNNSFVAVISNT